MIYKIYSLRVGGRGVFVLLLCVSLLLLGLPGRAHAARRGYTRTDGREWLRTGRRNGDERNKKRSG